MIRSTAFSRLAGLLVPAVLLAAPPAAADGPALYQTHCAACHGADRLGGVGPCADQPDAEADARAGPSGRHRQRPPRHANARLRRDPHQRRHRKPRRRS
ncbi:MAG: c-type cytochrome [Pseudomonadota bacterium]